MVSDSFPAPPLSTMLQMQYTGAESWSWEHNMRFVTQLTGRSDGTVTLTLILTLTLTLTVTVTVT